MFEGLYGQRAVKGKIAALFRRGTPGHAHLFCGESGMGKRSFARAFAKALLCKYAGGASVTAGVHGGAFNASGAGDAYPIDADGLPCGACVPCSLFDTGGLDDFICVEPVGQGRSPMVSVDAVRMITDWLATRPLYAARKVYVIAEADRMTEQAQNALLKTLEEPPGYAVAILTAENPDALLDTVRSRCAATRFSRYTEGELDAILSAMPGIAAAADGAPRADLAPGVDFTRMLLRLCGGRPGRAVEIAGSDSFFPLRDELFGLFCGHLRGDARASYGLASFLERNRAGFAGITDMMTLWLRDMWLLTLDGGCAERSAVYPAGAGLVNADKAQELLALRGRYRAAAVLDAIERVEAARLAVGANAAFPPAVSALLAGTENILE